MTQALSSQPSPAYNQGARHLGYAYGLKPLRGAPDLNFSFAARAPPRARIIAADLRAVAGGQHQN
jgi:hypothetical protein